MNYPRGTGLFTRIFINFRESLRPKNKIPKKFVQKDYLGNSYFEIAADPSRGKPKPIRSFIPPSEHFDDFDQPLPPEWDAWLRLRRIEPPTDEEIQFHLAIQEKKKLAANDIALNNGSIENFDKNPFTSFPLHKEYEISPGLAIEQKTSVSDDKQTEHFADKHSKQKNDKSSD